MKTTKSRSTDPRWRPRRKGNRYCAPACGRGCTVAEHQRATELADALVAKLGGDWRPRVWENLGWHSEVAHPTGLVMRQYGPRDFNVTTETGSGDFGGGASVVHQHSARGTTPAAALKNLRAKLLGVRERVDALLRVACE